VTPDEAEAIVADNPLPPTDILQEMLPPPPMTAILLALASAFEGDCQCDTCISLRGMAQGLGVDPGR